MEGIRGRKHLNFLVFLAIVFLHLKAERQRRNEANSKLPPTFNS